MQRKRKKRSRIRAAKVTAGHGHKKKNRGAGHRGGRGKAGAGKRGDAKIMKITKGNPKYLGKHGFKSIKPDLKIINLRQIQASLNTWLDEGLISKSKDVYSIDLKKMGYDKLLSKGDVNHKLEIKVDSATQNAVSRVEKAGGSVELKESKENK